MDLAATWLDLAGVALATSGMTRVTSRSLRAVLNGSAASNRAFVSSGLGQNASGAGASNRFDWRMVVRRHGVVGDGVLLKYICCKGTCPGSPSNVASIAQGEWMELLYNVEADAAEMVPLNISKADAGPWAGQASAMRALLPPAFAAGCASIVPPPPRFLITHDGGSACVKAASVANHAVVSLGPLAAGNTCSVWHMDPRQAINLADDAYALMAKHGQAGAACTPSTVPGTVELGPTGGQFGFSFARGRLELNACVGICATVTTRGGPLGTANCSSIAGPGFALRPL